MLSKQSVLYVGGFSLLIVIAGVGGALLRPKAPCPPPTAAAVAPVPGTPAPAKSIADTKFDQANKFANTREYDKAITILKELVDKGKTKDVMQITKLAECYVMKKNFAEAERYLKEAEKVNNKMPFIYRTYARISIEKKDYPKAKDYLNQSMALSDNDSDKYFTFVDLAVLAENQKDFKGAMDNVDQALKINAKDDAAREMKIYIQKSMAGSAQSKGQ